MTAQPTRREWWSGLGLAVIAVLACAGVVIALRALGHGNLAPPPLRSLGQFRGWLDRRDTSTASIALLRLGALAVACYLLAVTCLGLLARLASRPGLARLVDAVTVPMARRLVRAVAGLSVSASSATLVVLPVLTHQARPPAPAVVTRDPGNWPAGGATDDHGTPHRRSSHDVVMKRIADPRGDGTVTMRVIPEPRPVTRPPPSVTSPPATFTIRSGDSFWHVAHVVLTATWHRPPTDVELLDYWHTLVEHNRSRLADPANADLVYPGQVFELPNPPAAPP